MTTSTAQTKYKHPGRCSFAIHDNIARLPSCGAAYHPLCATSPQLLTLLVDVRLRVSHPSLPLRACRTSRKAGRWRGCTGGSACSAVATYRRNDDGSHGRMEAFVSVSPQSSPSNRWSTSPPTHRRSRERISPLEWKRSGPPSQPSPQAVPLPAEHHPGRTKL